MKFQDCILYQNEDITLIVFHRILHNREEFEKALSDWKNENDDWILHETYSVANRVYMWFVS